jgi:citrate lyase subunit gamma (acyl carrier protein)
MIGRCGEAKDSDALVTVNLNTEEKNIEIISKLEGMFGKLIKEAVLSALKDMKVENAHVKVEDFGALDFVIKARTKTAIRRARKNGGNL